MLRLTAPTCIQNAHVTWFEIEIESCISHVTGHATTDLKEKTSTSGTASSTGSCSESTTSLSCTCL